MCLVEKQNLEFGSITNEQIKSILSDIGNLKGRKTAWIRSDLKICKSNIISRFFWNFAKNFNWARNFFYGVNLIESQKNLETIRIKVVESNDEDLYTLYVKAAHQFNSIAPRYTVSITNSLLSVKKAATTDALPTYAEAFCNDLSISPKCRELFKELFIDIINPSKINNIQPLGQLVAAGGELSTKLYEFNAKYFPNDPSQHLGCRGSNHSSDENDPWQTIKIVAPNIKTLGETSGLMLELKKGLDKHYHLKSGGGGNWTEWVKKPFEEKMKLNKYDPVCFSEKGGIMTPQIMLTLIDIKKIVGIIPNDEKYVEALSNAYYSGQNYKGDKYAKPSYYP